MVYHSCKLMYQSLWLKTMSYDVALNRLECFCIQFTAHSLCFVMLHLLNPARIAHAYFVNYIVLLMEQAQKEIEGLRKEFHDGRNLRTLYEHLIQVNNTFLCVFAINPLARVNRYCLKLVTFYTFLLIFICIWNRLCMTGPRIVEGFIGVFRAYPQTTEGAHLSAAALPVGSGPHYRARGVGFSVAIDGGNGCGESCVVSIFVVSYGYHAYR
jgi:hypothetical protein